MEERNMGRYDFDSGYAQAGLTLNQYISRTHAIGHKVHREHDPIEDGVDGEQHPERIICMVGIVVFLCFTAYDTQKIKANYEYFYGDEAMLQKASIEKQGGQAKDKNQVSHIIGYKVHGKHNSVEDGIYREQHPGNTHLLDELDRRAQKIGNLKQMKQGDKES